MTNRLVPLFFTLTELRPVPYNVLLPLVEAGHITTEQAEILQTPRPNKWMVAVGRVVDGETKISVTPEV